MCKPGAGKKAAETRKRNEAMREAERQAEAARRSAIALKAVATRQRNAAARTNMTPAQKAAATRKRNAALSLPNPRSIYARFAKIETAMATAGAALSSI